MFSQSFFLLLFMLVSWRHFMPLSFPVQCHCSFLFLGFPKHRLCYLLVLTSYANKKTPMYERWKPGGISNMCWNQHNIYIPYESMKHSSIMLPNALGHRETGIVQAHYWSRRFILSCPSQAGKCHVSRVKSSF